MNCKRCGQIKSRRDEPCEHCGAPLQDSADENMLREDEAVDVNFVIVDGKNNKNKGAPDDIADEDDYDDDYDDGYDEDDYDEDDYDDGYDEDDYDDDSDYDDGYKNNNDRKSEQRQNRSATQNRSASQNRNAGQNWQAGQNVVMPPPKKRWLAIVLCIFVGALGIHRFYLGLYKSGFILFVLAVPLGILTGGLTEIVVLMWLIYDLVMLIMKKLQDSHGRNVGVYND